MTQVRYVGAHDAVVINVGGVDLDVSRDAVIDVPATLAGIPPTAARLAAEQALVDAEQAVPRIHEVCASARAALVDLADQCGSGLLAQVDNWQPVTAKAAPKPKDGE